MGRWASIYIGVSWPSYIYIYLLQHQTEGGTGQCRRRWAAQQHRQSAERRDAHLVRVRVRARVRGRVRVRFRFRVRDRVRLGLSAVGGSVRVGLGLGLG